jgi:hypothetical protein
LPFRLVESEACLPAARIASDVFSAASATWVILMGTASPFRLCAVLSNSPLDGSAFTLIRTDRSATGSSSSSAPPNRSICTARWWTDVRRLLQSSPRRRHRSRVRGAELRHLDQAVRALAYREGRSRPRDTPRSSGPSASHARPQPAYWITVETIAMTSPLRAVILLVCNEGEVVELEVGRL